MPVLSVHALSRPQLHRPLPSALVVHTQATFSWLLATTGRVCAMESRRKRTRKDWLCVLFVYSTERFAWTLKIATAEEWCLQHAENGQLQRAHPVRTAVLLLFTGNLTPDQLVVFCFANRRCPPPSAHAGSELNFSEERKRETKINTAKSKCFNHNQRAQHFWSFQCSITSKGVNLSDMDSLQSSSENGLHYVVAWIFNRFLTAQFKWHKSTTATAAAQQINPLIYWKGIICPVQGALSSTLEAKNLSHWEKEYALIL